VKTLSDVYILDRGSDNTQAVTPVTALNRLDKNIRIPAPGWLFNSKGYRWEYPYRRRYRYSCQDG